MALLGVKFLQDLGKFFVNLLCSLFDAFVKVVNDGQKVDVFVSVSDLVEMTCSKSFID